MKILTIYIWGLLLLCSCRQTENKIANETVLEDTIKIGTIQPTDSVLLLKHLDSLPEINFPYLSEYYPSNFPTVIDLSTFKDQKLFNLPFTRIPRSTKTGSIDQVESDTTFNLTDSNYQARWNLIAKTPKFVVVEVYDEYAFLAILTYDLKLIDAIRTGYTDPGGNTHWGANRHSIINKDLTVLLQHESPLKVDENNKYETETAEEKWFIDADGRINQK